MSRRSEILGPGQERPSTARRSTMTSCKVSPIEDRRRWRVSGRADTVGSVCGDGVDVCTSVSQAALGLGPRYRSKVARGVGDLLRKTSHGVLHSPHFLVESQYHASSSTTPCIASRGASVVIASLRKGTVMRCSDMADAGGSARARFSVPPPCKAVPSRSALRSELAMTGTPPAVPTTTSRTPATRAPPGR